ncbi:hypothetical protein C8F04DRAFT_1253973 [Mycena alexandri]|uniref:Uncharacterized protein n=1 Tax=Mycena alexandri TaxID=1745969 RepID=A0AAD6T7C7_9AGAR|nr:hypothetical protein C8F04DRAFT_1253973 [Mycena alexandri]
MTSEEDNVGASLPMRAREYDVATTKVIYGLSSADQRAVLATLRTDFHTAAAEQRCMVSSQTYDIACQWYQKVEGVTSLVHSSGSEAGDEDSLFSVDDEELPPLLPASPSDESDTERSPAGQVKDTPLPAPAFLPVSATLLNAAVTC